MVGVICPSLFEYRALDLKRVVKKGGVCVRSGMGKLRSLHACAQLRAAHTRLKAIVLVGFAGALTHDLEIGEVVEPKIFIEQDYNAEPFEKFPNLIKKKTGGLVSESRPAVMLTQDRFLKTNPYLGSAYEKKFKTLACDMESYAVAYFCKKTKLKYAVAKIISDRADHSADHDFLKACRELSPKLNRLTFELIDKLQ